MSQPESPRNLPPVWMDEDETIIYTKVYDWDWQDLNRIVGEAYTMQDSVTYGTYCIYDLTESRRTVPHGAIRHMRDLVNYAHPNDLLIIIVGASEIIRVVLSIVGRVYQLAGVVDTYRFVDTMQEANTLIAAHKAKLALKPNQQPASK